MVIISCFLAWFTILNVYAVIIWLICTITGERLHFIEISDQDWCPKLFRGCIRNCLHYGWTFFDLTPYIGSPAYTVSNIVAPGIKKLGCSLIIDLCSGSGGPTPDIHRILNRKARHKTITTILTDLFPQISVWKSQCAKSENLLFSQKSVNAALVNVANIPEISRIYHNEVHFRTLFGSFHHFKPALAVSILADAMECGDAFIMAEAVLRRQTFFDFVQWPLQLTALTPFFIGYMIYQQLFVYDLDMSILEKIWKCILIVVSSPLWAAAFIHDGIISNARVYTEEELMDLAESAKVLLRQKYTKTDGKKLEAIETYQWKCWRQNSDMIFPLSHLAPITVLLGFPKVTES